jgi:hypothetical protein
MWQLTDYKWMQGNVEFGRFMFGPHRFLSMKTHKHFDCAAKCVGLQAFTEFTRHMGAGRSVNGSVAITTGFRLNRRVSMKPCGKLPEGKMRLPTSDAIAETLSRFVSFT